MLDIPKKSGEVEDFEEAFANFAVLEYLEADQNGKEPEQEEAEPERDKQGKTQSRDDASQFRDLNPRRNNWLTRADDRALIQDTMRRLVPVLNLGIAARKKDTQNGETQDRAEHIFNLAELETEWAQGTFGKESQRAWRSCAQFLETAVIDNLRLLDKRGLDIPAGCPLEPPLDASGRHIGDELFRARLHRGDLTLSLAEGNLQDGVMPSSKGIAKLCNSLTWVADAQRTFNSALIFWQASRVEQCILGMNTNGALDGWLPAKDMSEAQLEQWTYGATTWMATATTVRNYAETIAFLHRKSCAQGETKIDRFLDSLPTLSKLLADLPEGAKIYPDTALQSGNFPGHLVRNAQTREITAVELALPDTPERTDANRAKMAKFDTWLNKYAPQVNQVVQELTACLVDQDRVVMSLEDTSPEPGAKYPPGHPKAGQEIGEYNLKRYHVEVEERDGKIIVRPYVQHYWKRDYAFNNWNILGDNEIFGVNIGAIQKVGDRIYTRSDEGQVFNKGDMLLLCDNGRIHLLDTNYLQKWVRAQETGEEIGRYVHLGLDIAMLLTGTAELKAAQLAAKKGGEVAMRQCVREAIKGSWHIGIGLTGFGQQAIENTFGDGGKQFTKWRQYAILTELTATQLVPTKWQNFTNKALWGKKVAQEGSVMEEYLAVASLSKAARQAHGIQGIPEMQWYDRVLAGAHHVMQGKKVPYLPVTVGVFPLVDYYFLNDIYEKHGQMLVDRLRGRPAQFGPGTTRDLLQTRGDRYEERQQPAYLGPYNLTADQIRQSSQRVLNEYKSSLARAGDKPQAEALAAQVSQARQLPQGQRQDLVDRCLTVFQTAKSHEEKLAAASGLVALLGDQQGNLPELLGVRQVAIPLLKVSKGSQEQEAQARSLAKPITVEVKGSEVRAFLDTTSGALLEATSAALLLPQNDVHREAHIAKLVEVFVNSKSHESKTAAAIGLLALRKKDDLAEVLGSRDIHSVLITHKRQNSQIPWSTILHQQDYTSPTTARQAMQELRKKYAESPHVAIRQWQHSESVTALDAIAFLRSQATGAQSNYTRLVAADMLMRLSHTSQNNLEHMQGQATGAEQRSTAELETVKLQTAKMQEFSQAVRFEYSDLGRICLDILLDPKSPKDLKMQAMVSPNSPRLGLVMEYLKYTVEPEVERFPSNQRAHALANLWGKDSRAISKVLESIMHNATEDADVRMMAASLLWANSTTRYSVNGHPVNTNSELYVGRGGYIDVEGQGIAERHAVLKVNNEGIWSVKNLSLDTGTTWIVSRNGQARQVRAAWELINPGDQVILGERSSGTLLRFGRERADRLAICASQWATLASTPGAYASSLTDLWRFQLNADLKSVLPEQGRSEIRANKLEAAVMLDQLGILAGLGTNSQRQVAINAALIDCFQPSQTELAPIVLSKLTPERLSQLSLEQRQTLCERALSMLQGQPAAGQTAGVDLQARIAVTRHLATLCQGANAEFHQRAVLALSSMLNCPVQDSVWNLSYSYAAGSPELRQAAVLALAKLDPGSAKVTLPEVLRRDPSAHVRLTALDCLVALAAPQLKQTCLQLLSTEGDPKILKRLRTIEYLERRPEYNSNQYQREFQRTRDVLLASSNRSLAGARQYLEENAVYIRRRHGLTPERREMMVANLWLNKEGPRPNLSYLFDGQLSENFRPEYDHQRVKALVYVVISNGLPFPESHGQRRQAVKDAAEILRRICEKEGPAGAKNMAWAMESCLLRQNTMDPQARLAILQGLVSLKPGANNGVISADEAAIVIADALRREFPRTPQPHQSLTFEDSKKLQLEMIRLLGIYQNTAVLPVLEALAASQDHPMPEVRDAARSTMSLLQDYSGVMRAVLKADQTSTEQALSQKLLTPLLDEKSDSALLCQGILLALNGSPIRKADDPRRNALYVALAEPHDKTKLISAYMLFQSTLPEDREEGAKILAALAYRTKSIGIRQDVQELVADLRGHPERYYPGDKDLLHKCMQAAQRQECARATRLFADIANPVLSILPSVAALHQPQAMRLNAARTLSYQEAYEAAQVELLTNWQNDMRKFEGRQPYLKEVGKHHQSYKIGSQTFVATGVAYELQQTSWFKDNGYDLIEGTVLSRRRAEAIHGRYDPASFKKTFDYFTSSGTTVAGERAKASKAVEDRMWEQYARLLETVKTNEAPQGKEARDFLGFVLLSNGRPFLAEHQKAAMEKAALAIYELVRSKGPGAGELDCVLKTALIGNAQMDAAIKDVLLTTFLWSVEPNGKVSKENGAIVLAAALENEYQNMPGKGEAGFEASEKMQLRMLDWLQYWGNQQISPVLSAFVQHHPSSLIRQKAGEMLAKFSS